MASLPRPRLGELLVRAGVVTPEQADAAAAVHRANDRTIGQQLLADGAVTELELAAALSYQLDVPLLLFGSFGIDDVAVHLTPPDLARAHRLLVVGARDAELLVAMARPSDLRAREALAERTGRRVVPLLALDSELAAEIERRFPDAAVAEPGAGAVAADRAGAAAAPPPGPAARAPGELVPFPKPGQAAPEPPRAEPPPREETAPAAARAGPERRPAPAPEPEHEPAPAAAPRAPIGLARPRAEGPESQIVRFVLAQAIRERAADVHLEPLADRLRVRFRVEGELREVSQLPRDMAAAVAARVRALAGMDAQERAGQLVVREEASGEATFDVTAVPTLWGEKIVLRVIERQGSAPDLDDLGMEAGTLERWREVLRSPYGLLLIAGMPGMGKTTTLYASARELPAATRDITSVEDPIAFALDGVNQVPVDRAGGSYPETLRAVLAQGPDIVLLGELRDLETGEIAMNAVLGGRLILSTIQAPDALAAAYRCIGLGIDPYLVSASLVAVLAQLLLPRLCEHCRVAQTPAMIEAALLRQAGLEAERVFTSRGCPRCGGTGHRGRVGVFQLLIPNEELRAALERGAPLEEARDVAARAGLVPLREAGLRLVQEGLVGAQDLMTRLPAGG